MNKKLYSPSMKALYSYNVWRAMAYNNHVAKDTHYWKKHDMLNDEYCPQIPCNVVKKLPFKIFYKMMQGFLKQNTVKSEKQ